MPVRMKDIARDLGVSVVTVSKVLRNHSDIGEETRQRVLQRMKELNYHPNLAARALVTGKSYSLGLIVPDLVHPFFAQVAKGISTAVRKKGYSLLISSSEEDPELEYQEIQQMLARRVDALLIASARTDTDTFRAIEEQQTPFILLDRTITGLNAHYVGVNDEEVGTLATRHLIEIGCRRIAHIRGPQISTGDGRAEGYSKALAAHGLEPRPGYVVMGRSGDDAGDVSGYDAMRILLSREPRPDGVFCYNDPTALGALKAILEAGLRVPEDIAVIGCGNVNYADLLRVPLSSIDQDSTALGDRAARLALKLVESKAPPRVKPILLEPRVVVRASTRRPTAGVQATPSLEFSAAASDVP